MKYKFLVLVLSIPLLAAACNKPNDQVTQTPPPTPPPVVTPVVPNPNPEPTPIMPTPTPKPQPSPQPNPPQPVPQPQPKPTPTPPPPITPPQASEKSFSVTANDSVATPNMITVNKGDKVNLTITLGTTDVYYAGLEFRGSGINSGQIMPGGTKTFSFTANSTLTLQAYWPSSGVMKSANIMVHVNE